MSKLNKMHEDDFLKIFFALFSLSFIVAAFCMPDRANMLTGLWEILRNPTKGATNFFSVGGYAATFLNMGLVGLICTGLFCIPGRKANNAATVATLLTVGFGSWGIHIFNMWPTMLGVVLHCIAKNEPIHKHTNAMLFSTGLAPFISELMVRYPNPEVVGFTPMGVYLAFAVGLAVGYFLPSGLTSSPQIHKGFTQYSAALPVGMIAFFLQSVMYKALGVDVPDAISDLSVGSETICSIFCVVFFMLTILIARLMGCTFKDYWKMLTSHQQVVHTAAGYGNAVMLMNVGVYGMFILIYFTAVGANFNGIVFGSIFCMLCTCNSGSHPFNTTPIILGYTLASKLLEYISPYAGGEFTQYLGSQAIVVGICYANGLSPISDDYGWMYGVLVAAMHFCMVTTVPQLHGGLCLYNGGFTAALLCLLMVPTLERHCRTKHERRMGFRL